MVESKSYDDTLHAEAMTAVENQGWSDTMFNYMPVMKSFIRKVHRLHAMFPSALCNSFEPVYLWGSAGGDYRKVLYLALLNIDRVI